MAPTHGCAILETYVPLRLRSISISRLAKCDILYPEPLSFVCSLSKLLFQADRYCERNVVFCNGYARLVS
jgi:hypothetical protein